MDPVAQIPVTFRYMAPEDVEAVLAIIEEHDEDDAEAAQLSYERYGIDGQYVMVADGQVIGVSGARLLDDCDNSFQLAWTYVTKAMCNQGFGRQLLRHILDQLTTYDGRKVFVYVSDYQDDDGNSVYAAALHLYQSLGFERELQIDDYYDQGESLKVLGLALVAKPADRLPIKPEAPKIKFVDLFLVAETESTFSFAWQTKRFGASFTVKDLETGVEAAKSQGATLVVVSFPSNYSHVKAPLTAAGFQAIGQLTDYYENDVHEDHYCYYC